MGFISETDSGGVIVSERTLASVANGSRDIDWMSELREGRIRNLHCIFHLAEPVLMFEHVLRSYIHKYPDWWEKMFIESDFYNTLLGRLFSSTVELVSRIPLTRSAEDVIFATENIYHIYRLFDLDVCSFTHASCILGSSEGLAEKTPLHLLVESEKKKERVEHKTAKELADWYRRIAVGEDTAGRNQRFAVRIFGNLLYTMLVQNEMVNVESGHAIHSYKELKQAVRWAYLPEIGIGAGSA